MEYAGPPLASGSLDWANGCTLYYTIRPRDNCYQVAQNFNIPGGYQQFLKWNTGLNADCQTLKLGYNYCVAGRKWVPFMKYRSDLV